MIWGGAKEEVSSLSVRIDLIELIREGKRDRASAKTLFLPFS